MKNISILGTGWLGFPLAKMLMAEGLSVKGSTTSAEKLPVLKQAGVEAFQIKVTSEGVEGNIEDFLSKNGILIVDFPPGLRKNPEVNYSEAIKKLAEAIETSGVKKVIFVSSISVYEETESFPVYTEDTQPNATSASGKEIISAEKILLENAIFDTTVIRFGGLYGAGRHPVKYLAGRSGLANPLGPVNLIHLEDCLQVIKKVLENDIFGEVYNAVFPLNPPKEKYYQQKAREMELELPQFDQSRPSVGKVISASKVMRQLGVEFSAGI
ncbi:NAD(P)H-binding protein [Salinimicrobium sp. MT39]|uniref:NAD(P)H-binding protein n=1 Tax=Salinimicrobium profundisediminis TaxID=2994553 RepID=A0A9X3CUE5_9FLAO|nr:NAD(P)H-binding protein [Salinimicrobium profundisediminis]MCX2836864.1 NAD(P)H-binding protein [Salinimicrobium profundisediminis]